MTFAVACGDHREVFPPAGYLNASLIFTSPPYEDAMSLPEYEDSQASFLVWAAGQLALGGTLVYNHKLRRADGRLVHPAGWFGRAAVRDALTLTDEIVWDRGSTHQHSRTM